MEYSSGVILHRKNENGEVEFFMCTPDGPYWRHKELWSFPKGHIEYGETPFSAALREFEEETSISLDGNSSNYHFHGLVKQNKNKRVYVYSKQWSGEETSNCTSNLTTTIFHGEEITHHEIKAYKWMTYSELLEKGMPCYFHILKDIESDNNN